MYSVVYLNLKTNEKKIHIHIDEFFVNLFFLNICHLTLSVFVHIVIIIYFICV